MPGPLTGLRVIELAGLGPAPHAAMVLGDLGADVVRLERPSGGLDLHDGATRDQMLRNRRSVAVDLKGDEGLSLARQLIRHADVVIEGFRPGVAERLGVGPEYVHRMNPGVVYGRITGWGQDGPRASTAGHDINYLALTGGLHAIGHPGGRPVPPLNLVADFGGGSLLLVSGILAALWERERSGRGQVIDAAMVDGATLLLQMTWSLRGAGSWAGGRGENLLDSGAPFYDTYECADGGYVAVGALEPQFYAQLVTGLGLTDLPGQYDRPQWPVLRARLADTFLSRPREHWISLFDGTDACVTPVLSWDEVAADEHVRHRGTVIDLDGVTQASPAPRFSRTPADTPQAPRSPGQDTPDVIRDWLGHEPEGA